MVIAGVGRGLKAEASLHLEAGMPAQVADVPERVRLALEQSNDDGATRGKR